MPKSRVVLSIRLCDRVPVRELLDFCAACSVSLQSLLAKHKDFGAAFKPLQRKLLDLQARVQAENGLQRDCPGKQAQLSRLQVRGLWGRVTSVRMLSCA